MLIVFTVRKSLVTEAYLIDYTSKGGSGQGREGKGREGQGRAGKGRQGRLTSMQRYKNRRKP